MKIVLDIDKLLLDDDITESEYARFKALAAEDTGSLAFNILIGFGVIATAAGALALLRSAPASIVLGLALSVAGVTLRARYLRQWGVLGAIMLLVGSILTAGGIVIRTEGGVGGFMAVTALCLAGGFLARSSLLVAMAALALSASVGAATAYDHAMYALVIRQPSVTVLLFGLLSWLAYRLSLRLTADYVASGSAHRRAQFWDRGSRRWESRWRSCDTTPDSRHRASLVRFFPPLCGNTHPTATIRCPQVLFAHHATSLAPQRLEIHWHLDAESLQLLFDCIQAANQAARIVPLGANAPNTIRKLLGLHQYRSDRARQ